ncbi:MAG: hypothetical protein Q9175_003261 [Cornicularia normoerica]
MPPRHSGLTRTDAVGDRRRCLPSRLLGFGGACIHFKSSGPVGDTGGGIFGGGMPDKVVRPSFDCAAAPTIRNLDHSRRGSVSSVKPPRMVLIGVSWSDVTLSTDPGNYTPITAIARHLKHMSSLSPLPQPGMCCDRQSFRKMSIASAVIMVLPPTFVLPAEAPVTIAVGSAIVRIICRRMTVLWE